jgi:modification methylase
MFSFAGDTVFDPFLGTGSTTIAAVRAGRNSIGNEIEQRVRKELDQPRLHGSCEAVLV